MVAAAIVDAHPPPTTPTAQQAGEEPQTFFGRTDVTRPVAVIREHPLDLLILLPANVAFVVLGTQHQPLLGRFLPFVIPPLAFCKQRCRFRLAIGVGARIDRIGQDSINRSIVRPPPTCGAVRPPDRKLQTSLAEPY